MIRYSRSFFISLAIHTLSFGLLFVVLESIIPPKEESEERVCLKLQEIQEPKKVAPKIEEPKKIEMPTEVVKPKKIEPSKEVVQKKEQTPKPKPLEEKIIKEEIVQESPKIKEETILEGDFSPKQNHTTQTAAPEVTSSPKESQPKDDSLEYIELNTQLIAQLIKENLSYPVSARRQGITGVVIIRFNLNIDAKISEIAVKESSSDILSRAAVQTIEELSLKLPKPSKNITLTVPIEYKLR